MYVRKSQLKGSVTLAAAGLGAWMAWRALRNHRGYDFNGKNVLITGSSRGLGLVMAREFAKEGANLIICARDQEELDVAYDELARSARQVIAIPCDLTDAGQVEEMVQFAMDRSGPIDVLVNNAGTIAVGPYETMTLLDYEDALRNNFWSALYATLAVLPSMRARHQGRIVNITSIGGKISVPHLLPYSVSKFAFVGLSEGLRAELAKDGIVVTTVCPGLMRTGSLRHAFFKGQHRAEYTWFSISDALPGLSMQAQRAARQIVNACKRGDAEVTLTLAAKFAVAVHGLFPGLTADAMALVNRLLPGPGGIGIAEAEGRQSHSPLSPSRLTRLSDEAARENNEVALEERLPEHVVPDDTSLTR